MYLIEQLKNTLIHWESDILKLEVDEGILEKWEIDFKRESIKSDIDQIEDFNDLIGYFMYYGQTYQFSIASINDLMKETLTISN